jgi:phosphoglycerol transferase MdoB-like AlkP superfamily enzyme
MGKKLPIYFICEYLYWYLLFAFLRSVFMLANTDELSAIPFTETLSTFYHALYLDTSMASYLVGISFFAYLCASAFQKNLFLKINRVYAVIVSSILTILTLAELDIYNEFGTKIGYEHVQHIVDLNEVFQSAKTWYLIFGFFVIAALTWLWFKMHQKITLKELKNEKNNWPIFILFFLITPILIALGIRGGTQQIPIQTGEAYFSKHNVLNIASVNTGWNVGMNIIENRNVLNGNPYSYYDLKEAEKTVRKIHSTEKDTTVKILTTDRPNIILLIMESWSADLIKSLGGYDSIMPNVEKIISEGILFENAYASGNLSDQGMACVLSAFPAQPITSIISQPSKYTHLPCITNEMTKVGYSTQFLFGGQLSYGNIKAYIYYNQFDKIIEEQDYDPAIKRGKLGVHDEHTYTRKLAELKKMKEPFFSAAFTTSTHSPFDYPGSENRPIKMGGDENDYVNAMHYADKELYKFLESSKKESWFRNTLFVIVPDHSHRSPKHWDFTQPEFKRIPIIFWGDVIKPEYRGYKHKKIVSQIDLASTILNQLNLSDSDFMWSKNAFNPYTPEFAYFETNEGIGWVRPDGYIVIAHSSDNIYHELVKSKEQKDLFTREVKSYLQVLFQQYTDF